jgi:WD40 repeat protein
VQSPANIRVAPPTAEIGATTPVAIWTVGSKTRHLLADGVSVPVRFAPGDAKLLMLTPTRSGDHPSVWNLSTRKPIAVRGVLPIGAHVDVARDGSVAIAAGSAITFWRAARDQPIRTSATSAVQALAVSPDATLVALGYNDGGLAIWRPEQGTAPRVIVREQFPVTLLAFSQDSRLLAAAASATISLLDVEGAREIGTLDGRSQNVNALAFSTDDKLLASGGDDKTIRLWDVKTRRPLGEALSMPAAVSAVAFGPQRLVARTSDGTVMTWDKGLWFVDSTSWPSLRDRLCGLVGRIDANEWKSVLAGASSQQPCKARNSGRTG